MNNRSFVLQLVILVIFSTTLNGSPSILQQEERAVDVISASDEFLSHPTMLSGNEISEGVKNRTLDMCFQITDFGHFRFLTERNGVYFEIRCLDAFPANFGETEKSLFMVESYFEGDKQRQSFFYSYRWNMLAEEEVNVPFVEDESLSVSTAYTVCKRRVIEDGHPAIMTLKELIAIVHDKNIVFYTGAGLSAASQVPTMSQLYTLLSLEDGERFLSSLKGVLASPKETILKIKSFHDACFLSPPTVAHWALKKLAFLKNTKIITENLDCLHESTGLMPYRINADRLISKVNPASLCCIDYVICIGLSYDDRGFLGWYKKHYPDGKIISIDLGIPSYLDDEDFLIKGDLQEIVPEILEKLMSVEKNSGKI